MGRNSKLTEGSKIFAALRNPVGSNLNQLFELVPTCVISDSWGIPTAGEIGLSGPVILEISAMENAIGLGEDFGGTALCQADTSKSRLFST